MVKKKNINLRELNNIWSIKLMLNDKERLETEVKILKRSLKLTQNAHEETKERKINLEKENLLLKDKLKINIIPEVLKIAVSIWIWYITNIITEEYSHLKLALLIVLTLIYISTVIYQYFRNN